MSEHFLHLVHTHAAIGKLCTAPSSYFSERNNREATCAKGLARGDAAVQAVGIIQALFM